MRRAFLMGMAARNRQKDRLRMNLSSPRKAGWLLLAGMLPLMHCGDYSKAQTSCTIEKKLILINSDHRSYIVTLADSSAQWTTDSTSEQTSTPPNFDFISPKVDTLDSLGRDTISIKVTWTVNHHTPWDHEICKQDGSVQRLWISLTRAVNDSQVPVSHYYFDTVSCEGLIPVFTEADSLTGDSTQSQSESYVCLDSLRIDQP
jgi:hypothetical protein